MSIIDVPAKANALVQHVARATVALPNREAWAAMGELIEDAGVPSSDREHHRKAAWAVRTQQRQDRPATVGSDGALRRYGCDTL